MARTPVKTEDENDQAEQEQPNQAEVDSRQLRKDIRETMAEFRDSEEVSSFVENLMPSYSNFRPLNSNYGKLTMNPYGYVGSIVRIPRNLARDSYLIRAAQRGKVKLYHDADEAVQRMVELEEMPKSHDAQNMIVESLSKEAATADNRYKVKNLPEMGIGSTPTPAEQVWANRQSGKSVHERT